ncbi:hypothetical protein ACIQWV_38800 [Streptomyces sp. NPDC098085]|uniref:hypothetical protein n=1 Tax=Streptomyces sp. NPDC098085 TaxID=3366094 RepID=UPI00380AA28E
MRAQRPSRTLVEPNGILLRAARDPPQRNCLLLGHRTVDGAALLVVRDDDQRRSLRPEYPVPAGFGGQFEQPLRRDGRVKSASGDGGGPVVPVPHQVHCVPDVQHGASQLGGARLAIRGIADQMPVDLGRFLLVGLVELAAGHLPYGEADHLPQVPGGEGLATEQAKCQLLG